VEELERRGTISNRPPESWAERVEVSLVQREDIACAIAIASTTIDASAARMDWSC
jgi:hypothetical protein